MIDADQIENWDTYASDAETLDRVLARVQRGVPLGREMNAEEVMPVLRMAYVFREACRTLTSEIDARQREAMSMGEPRKK